MPENDYSLVTEDYLEHQSNELDRAINSGDPSLVGAFFVGEILEEIVQELAIVVLS